MPKNRESLEDLKYLLGFMGFEILYAISKGAKEYETIKLFSGIPLSCIKGRIPVLLDLNLISKNNYNEYCLTSKGIEFNNRMLK